MYAVVQTGGKQYKVAVGETVVVEKVPGAEAGGTVELDQVLMIGQDDSTVVGQPTVAGARVLATVADVDFKGEKLIVFKYKPKVRYRRKKGHRQHHTRLVIDEIVQGGESKGRRERKSSGENE